MSLFLSKCVGREDTNSHSYLQSTPAFSSSYSGTRSFYMPVEFYRSTLPSSGFCNVCLSSLLHPTTNRLLTIFYWPNSLLQLSCGSLVVKFVTYSYLPSASRLSLGRVFNILPFTITPRYSVRRGLTYLHLLLLYDSPLIKTVTYYCLPASYDSSLIDAITYFCLPSPHDSPLIEFVTYFYPPFLYDCPLIKAVTYCCLPVPHNSSLIEFITYIH